MPPPRCDQVGDSRARRRRRAPLATKRPELAALLLTLAACTAETRAPPVAAAATLRTIGSGQVIGTLAENLLASTGASACTGLVGTRVGRFRLRW